VTISLDSIPRFSAAEALGVAESDFGIGGAIAALPSERDQNFLIIDARGGKFVLKIANAGDGAALLDFQNQAMRRVAAAVANCRVPRVMETRAGRELSGIRDGATGALHCVRLLTWVDGEVLANVTGRPPGLHASIGEGMGRVDAALHDFTHAAMHRELQWDVRRAGLAAEHVGLLPPARRERVQGIFAQWGAMDWRSLRHGVIHGDANDHNVIIESGRMAGLLDFGDMGYSALVCDPAIALAYVLLDQDEPRAVATRVIGAYHRCNPLSDAEQRVLFVLMISRLAMSVCYAADNRARNPDDPYQVVTEAAAWSLLDVLEQWSLRDGHDLVRAACADAAGAE
jgi:Ser/Thr protein kinase RdoA (MazF antagonist)